MRRIFTTADAYNAGLTQSALRFGVRAGRWQRLGRGVYIQGNTPPTPLEKAIGVAIAVGGVVSGSAAAMLHELDYISLTPPFATVPSTARPRRQEARRHDLRQTAIVERDGFPCTDGLQTLLDLAAVCDERRWEQALESALRKRLTTLHDVTAALPSLSASRTAGVRVIRNVLACRPSDAPPTESFLETLMVQLIRDHTELTQPTRQVEILSKHGTFVARVDFAWPDIGLFLECDGRQHAHQQTYDTHRETSVIAIKGWLMGRFTWHQVRRTPVPTARRIVELYKQAQRLHTKAAQAS
jgi:very-short-patch-repair endonuclease